MHRHHLIFCVLTLSCPALLSAQQVSSRWSADATVGAATAHGGDFFSVGRAAAHFSVSGRVLQRGRFAAYAEAGYDWYGQYGIVGSDPDGTCIVDRPGAGCEPPFPDVAGPSASIGLLYAPARRVETRLGVGGAACSVDGTRVGAAIGQADAAFFPAAHLGLILGARFVAIPRYRHDRLTMVPVLFGLRVR